MFNVKYDRFGRKWPSAAYFARKARITWRGRPQSDAECYGTLADDQNTISDFTGSEYSTSHVAGSTFLVSTGLRIVDLEVQATVFAVYVKPEVVVSRPEGVSGDRKWLPPAETQRLKPLRIGAEKKKEERKKKPQE